MSRRLVPTIPIVLALISVLGSCGDNGSPTAPTPTCSYAISPATAAIDVNGGTGTISISAGTGCTWSATTGSNWITITGNASGSGSGSVAYTVPGNTSTSNRSGTLTIAGQTHTVTQPGRPAAVCTLELTPASAEFTHDAATGSFAVSGPPDCTWTATSGASWLVVSTGTGTGAGTVSYSVTRNFDPAERSATISVGDRTFAVRQSGDVVPTCTYSVSPVEFTPCMPASSVVATVTTQSGCSWTATPDVSWLGVPSGSSSTGSGTITIAFPDNFDAPRSGIVMVRWPTPTAGQNIRIAQAGCTYAVTKSAISFTAAGGAGTFDVVQQSVPNTCGGATQDRCVWTAASTVPWITITSSMPRSGDNPVNFTVAANSGAAREGRITVRDKVVVISQAAQ